MHNTQTLFRETPPEADFLTTTELAKVFRVSIGCIHRLIHAGAFPNTVKMSRCYRISRLDVDAFLAKGGMFA